MRSVGRLSLAAAAAAALLQACAPPPASAPRALQVCSDKAGRRVEDGLCRGDGGGEAYLWYFFDAGVPVPPLGSVLAGGSVIATNGLTYVTTTGEAGDPRQGPPQGVEEAPAPPPAETVVTRDASGGFVVDGAVNGHPVTFVVDTGASDVVLSPQAAASIGLRPTDLTYDRVYQTANGLGHGASIKADRITVGSISISGVSAAVNQSPMKYSLLGRAFLDRLKSFRIEDGRLYLR